MQSVQARQRKRERKRLKREEKRRSLGSSLPLGLVPFPGPKMSDTLLDYARPLIDGLPDDAGLEELRALLKFASVVWNAVVEEDGDVDEAVLNLTTDMTAKLQGPPPEAVIEWLAERKVYRYGDDPRIVLSVEVFRNGDQLRVMAASAV